MYVCVINIKGMINSRLGFDTYRKTNLDIIFYFNYDEKKQRGIGHCAVYYTSPQSVKWLNKFGDF